VIIHSGNTLSRRYAVIKKMLSIYGSKAAGQQPFDAIYRKHAILISILSILRASENEIICHCV